jgi:acetyl/propionyl-CoA carboxylase alpha subunit
VKYKIRIADQDYEVEKTQNGVIVNGKPAAADMVKTAENCFHLVLGYQSYSLEVTEFNKETREMTLLINGKKTTARIQDEFDQLLAGMGMQAAGARKAKELKAPMPGLVVDVLVTAGQAFEKGQPMLVLEAMKMENVLKATQEGVVKAIEVQKGNAVEKNQVLITFQ